MGISRKIKDKLTLNTRDLLLRVGLQQVMIIVGAVMSALGYVVFQMPYKIAAGGVSGLGIIVYELTGFSTGYFYLLANIPLFVLGYYSLGKWRFVFSSFVAVVVFSLSTELFIYSLPQWSGRFPLTDDALLASIYAGVLYGFGTGIIYRFGGTIGGTSVTARIIYNKTGFPMSQSYLCTDLIIVLLAGLVFSMETVLLALITLVLVGIFSDYVLEGTSQTRTITIISKNPLPIQEAIMYELRRGVSYWDIVGGYSGERRTMLFLTVLRSRVYDVKFIVSRIDPDAFVVVGVSQQTWGGYNAKKL